MQAVKGDALTAASRLILTRVKQVQKQIGPYTDLSPEDTEAFLLHLIDIKGRGEFWVKKDNLNAKTVFQYATNWESYSTAAVHNWTPPSQDVPEVPDARYEGDQSW